VTVAGFVEAALTFGIVAYLQRANLPLLRANEAAPVRVRRVWIGIGALVALTPLGLLAPGGAFGEDAPDAARLWRHTPLAGYGDGSAVEYVLSACAGLAAIGLVVAAIRLLRRGVPA
jgi:cobalt/nickel transport system permease protein